MIKEFKYGQTWKIWPFPLSLPLCNPFKDLDIPLTNARIVCMDSANVNFGTLFLCFVGSNVTIINLHYALNIWSHNSPLSSKPMPFC